MIDQGFSIIKTVVGPALASAVSWLFGIPVATLIAAFAGSWMAVAVGEKTTFARTAPAIVGGTIVSGYMTPAFLHFMGELPQRPAAAAIAFLAVHKGSRDWLIEKVKAWFTR